MNEMSLELAVLIVILTVLLKMSSNKVEQYERAIVFRLGIVQRYLGPGVTFIAPFVDKIVKVSLDENVPGWKGMSEEKLEQRVREHVVGAAK